MYLEGLDWAIFLVGMFAAMITGSGMPMFVFLFRGLVNDMNVKAAADIYDNITRIAMFYLIVGGILWITCYFFFSFMGVIAEKVGFAYRKRYLEAVLRQETGWFETFDVMELPSRMSKECLAI